MMTKVAKCEEIFLKEYSKMLECIKNSTANLIDTILNVTIVDSNESQGKIDMADLWKTRFGIAMEGRKYTMNQSYPLSDKFYSRIVLPNAGNFNILFHDPRYFVDYTEKQKAFPNPFPIKLKEGLKSLIQLDITHEVLLSTNNNECNMDKNYSLIVCT